ncbi:MAG: hypothetical protein ACTSRP_04690 [Candidatus Helarchaeota archaeon]
MSKEKNGKNGTNDHKHEKIVLISTILIITLSVFSVVAAFYIFSSQNLVKKYSEETQLRYSILNIIDKDINKILSEDKQRQQISLLIQEDLLEINDEIKSMKNYNTTHPGTYNQTDIDKKALEFVSKMTIVNNLIRSSLAYNWSIQAWAIHENNYTYNDTEYYFIIDRYQKIKKDLDPDIISMVNIYVNESDREILEINMKNWEAELFNDLQLVQEYGQYSNIYAIYYDVWISGYTYNEALEEVNRLDSIAGTYDQFVKIMTTALVIMTIAGVIIAFLVSIDKKMYIYLTLIIGSAVSILGFWLFFLSFKYLYAANVLMFFG